MLLQNLHFGVKGIGIASSIAYMLGLLIMCWYLSKKRYEILHPNAWHWMNKYSFRDWGQYIRKGFMPALLNSMNMWAFECLLLFVSWIGKIELASYTIVITLTGFLIQGPKGFASSAEKLVGHALKQNHPKKAKKYAYTAITFGFISGACFGSMILFGETLAQLFTNNQEVIDNYTKLSRLVALLVLTDHTQIVEGGVIKAMRNQKYTELIVALVMICIGVPTSYYLAFKADMKIIGAYLGIIISIALVAFVFSLNLCMLVDWSMISHEAARKNEAKKRNYHIGLVTI